MTDDAWKEYMQKSVPRSTRDQYGIHVDTKCGTTSLTKQAFRESADINHIVEKWTQTGVPPAMKDERPVYGEYADVGTFQENLMKVQNALEQFEALPAKLRAFCDNDPTKFVGMIGDEKHREAFEEHGLKGLMEHIHGPSKPDAVSAESRSQAPAEAPEPSGPRSLDANRPSDTDSKGGVEK